MMENLLKDVTKKKVFHGLTEQVKDELQLITILTAIYLSNNESSKKKHVLLYTFSSPN